MWIEHFGDLDQGTSRADYRQLRLKVREALDVNGSQRGARQASDVEVLRVDQALREHDRYPWGCDLVAQGEVGVAPEAVAARFRSGISEICGALERLLESSTGRAAAAMGCRPEVGFAISALSALAYIESAEEGLDVRCEDLRQGLNRLEELLRQSGEVGETADWVSSDADPESTNEERK